MSITHLEGHDAEIGATLLIGIKARLAHDDYPSPAIISLAHSLTKRDQHAVKRGQPGTSGDPTRDDEPMRLLALSDAARALTSSVSTVRRRVRSGALPSVKEGGRRMIRAADLAAYMTNLER